MVGVGGRVCNLIDIILLSPSRFSAVHPAVPTPIYASVLTQIFHPPLSALPSGHGEEGGGGRAR